MSKPPRIPQKLWEPYSNASLIFLDAAAVGIKPQLQTKLELTLGD